MKNRKRLIAAAISIASIVGMVYIPDQYKQIFDVAIQVAQEINAVSE